jgi:hypothetical protein
MHPRLWPIVLELTGQNVARQQRCDIHLPGRCEAWRRWAARGAWVVTQVVLQQPLLAARAGCGGAGPAVQVRARRDAALAGAPGSRAARLCERLSFCGKLRGDDREHDAWNYACARCPTNPRVGASSLVSISTIETEPAVPDATCVVWRVQWLPTDRRRKCLAFRFQPHDEPMHNWFGEPPTREQDGGLPKGWLKQPTLSGSFEDIAPRLMPQTMLIAWERDGRKAIAQQADPFASARL